jgi:O-antigen ligase
VAGLTKNKLERKPFLHPQVRNLFIVGCVLYFFMQLASMLYTTDTGEGWRHIRIKTGLLIIPLAIACTDYLWEGPRKQLKVYYCLLLGIAALYCLGYALEAYWRTGHPSVFYYHELAGALGHHAVFFSILLFSGLVFLLERIVNSDWMFHRVFHLLLVAFLSVFLFLLSSKLVIIFYFLYVICYLVRLMIAKKTRKTTTILLCVLFVASVSGTMLIRNPVSTRFYEITGGDPGLIKKTRFDPSDYFNGLQFRLIQWRLVKDILAENNAWLTGVGVGDAQEMLDGQYKQKNMYTGVAGTNDRGYLSYHTHNQFLQACLQTGIPGVLIFVVICFALIRWARQKKNWETTTILALLITWSFSDAVFESQYGIVIFTFFPLFLCLGRQKSRKPEPA